MTSTIGPAPVIRPDVAEPQPTARLLAQRGLFAGPSALVSKDLYCTVRGPVTRSRDAVELEPSSSASMNTYFGRFPASYWQRWTDAAEVVVELTVCGSGQVYLGASDWQGEPRRVAARAVVTPSEQRLRLTAKLDRFLDGGALWLELETEPGQALTVSGVRWTVDAPAALRPTAVTICTMNRADDCLATLQAIAADLSAQETLHAVYVADQGSDPVESRAGFAQVAVDLGAKLHYLRQPNLGGAGGFTRGLYEAGPDVNVLFMDDDVLLEPDLIVRLTAFANRTTSPVIVGGQMLNLLHPHQLHVGAEYAELNQLQPGVAVPHSPQTADLLGVDRHTGEPTRQDRRLDAGYNGWWSCLIPHEVVQVVGYPLPLFFQWDDAEYGYRARANGFPTVTLPGAGVWHADFAWKDWDEWHRYFNLRNSIITAALHSPFDTTVVLRVLLAQFVRYLLGMQYGLAATLIKAVEDFLQGPGILDDGGVRAMREVRELRALYPETLQHPATAVPGIDSAEIGIVNDPGRPSMQRAVLLKRLLFRLLGKHVYDVGQVPADEAHWWHVSLFRTAVVTDASQQGVRVRSYDRQRMLRLARDGARVLARLRREGPAVRDDFQRALPELASRENWQRLYRL